MSSKIRILLAEDHNLVREGIKNLLNKEADMEVLAEAMNGHEALTLLQSNSEIDVVVTDINMPGMDGLALTEKLKEQFPAIRVIILSMLDQAEYIYKAFRMGARGYILKNVSNDELLFAIRHVHFRNERYICSELGLRLLDKQINASTLPELAHSDFTKREMEVLILVADGFTNQEIADKLFTSKRTVEGHRQALIDKTGARNSAALIRFAILNGLIH